MITIRREKPADANEIRELNQRAFGGSDEADLVDRLRESCPEAIPTVAQTDDRLVGHILFTPVVIRAPGREWRASGLAPMSVLPEYQRQGIGSKLVASGLELVRASGVPIVVVLGHPNYYSRFGFSPASKYDVTCEFDVTDEMFMLLELDKPVESLSGVAYYHHEFDVWKSG